MRRLKQVRTALSHLTRTDWAFLHFKAAIGIMLMTPLVQLGSVKSNTNTTFVWVWLTITLIGFWVSLVGLVMSAQKHKVRRDGFRVEMIGLRLMLSGPLVFIAIQVGVWWSTGRQTVVAIALCYVIAAAIFARMVMVKSAAKSRTVIYKFTEERSEDD